MSWIIQISEFLHTWHQSNRHNLAEDPATLELVELGRRRQDYGECSNKAVALPASAASFTGQVITAPQQLRKLNKPT
jgi:hypothetical protein